MQVRTLPAALYLLIASFSALALTVHYDRPWGLLALVPGIFGRWGIVASAFALRLSFIGLTSSDPIAVSQAAFARMMQELSPYGFAYAESSPPGAPYPYGPLGMVWWLPGPTIELAASLGILLLLAWTGRRYTLALYAGLPVSIYLAASGITDESPTLLLAAGLILLPRWYGGALVGLSVALKPYTFVFLPAVFAGGSWGALVAGVVVAGVGWFPALLLGGYERSIAMVEALHGRSAIRWIAAPIAAGGFLMTFRWAVLVGCAAFLVLMMTGGWWGWSYFIPVGVAAGIALEPSRYTPSNARTPQTMLHPERSKAPSPSPSR